MSEGEVWLCSLTIGLFEVVVEHDVLKRHQILCHLDNPLSSQTVCTHDAFT